MEARRTVTGTAASVYQTLLELFQADYLAATGETIAQEDIKEGLTYVKHFGKQQEQSVRITVGELLSNQRYTVAVQSNRGVQWLTY